MRMLQEYLESGDVEEAALCIGSFRLPMYDYYIVKRAITLAMDRKDREREAISTLLSSLYGQCISPQQMQKVCQPLLLSLYRQCMSLQQMHKVCQPGSGHAVVALRAVHFSAADAKGALAALDVDAAAVALRVRSRCKRCVFLCCRRCTGSASPRSRCRRCAALDLDAAVVPDVVAIMALFVARATTAAVHLTIPLRYAGLCRRTRRL